MFLLLSAADFNFSSCFIIHTKAFAFEWFFYLLSDVLCFGDIFFQFVSICERGAWSKCVIKFWINENHREYDDENGKATKEKKKSLKNREKKTNG